MSQYVTRATGIASKALDAAKTKVVPPAVEWYTGLMARNAQYVVTDPVAVEKLGKQMVFSNMAKLPAAVQAAQGEMRVVQQKWNGRMDLPMAEVRAVARNEVGGTRKDGMAWRTKSVAKQPPNRSRRDYLPPALTKTPHPPPPPGWHRRAVLRGGVRVVLRRGNRGARRRADRVLRTGTHARRAIEGEARRPEEISPTSDEKSVLVAKPRLAL